MKLHRIIVTNLNSLYGEQVVDLDRDLYGAPLFLIQGPTGAGKSTLMDAVSLALFGSTPRLENLASRDVAEQVMSRGTGVAQAQVEFSKRDAASGRRERYRATWSARRAHKRAEGKMQAIARSMERIEDDGTAVILVSDHRESHTKETFQQVLEGFTPQDFQRSMLLAQGRFDAMLHAKPDERAAILERLTETGMFLRIGERAAEVRGAWRRRIGKLKAKAEAISPVTPAELAAAKKAVAERQQALASLDATLGGLKGQRDWLIRAATLQAEQKSALAEQAAVTEAEVRAAAELEALAEHERCAEALALEAKTLEAGARLRSIEGTHRQLAEKLPAMQQQLEAAEQGEREAERISSEAQVALEALREPVQGAIDADKEVQDSQAELDGAAGKVAAAEVSLVEKRERRGLLEVQASESAAALAKAEAAHQALQGDAPLAEALPALIEQAAAISEAHEGLQRDQENLAAARGKLARRAKRLSRDRKDFETDSERRLLPLRERFESAGETLVGLVGDATDPDDFLQDLEERRDAAQQRAQGLERAELCVERRDQARTWADLRSEELAQAESRLGKAQAELARREQKHEVLAEALEQAKAVLAPLDRIAELCSKREVLGEDEPCPLCGSLEHPYVSDPAQRKRTEAIQEEREEASQALETAREALEGGRKATERAGRTVASQRAQLEAAAKEGSKAKREFARAEAKARDALLAVALKSSASEKSVLSAQKVAARQIDGLRSQADDIEQARKERRSAEKKLEREKRVIQGELQALRSRATGIQEAQQLQLAQAQDQEQRQAKLGARRGELADTLGGFDIRTSPAEAGIAQARARVQALDDARDGERSARTVSENASRDLKQAVEAVAAAQQDLDTRKQERGGRAQALAVAQQRAAAARDRLRLVWDAALAADGAEPVDRPKVDAEPKLLLASQAKRSRALVARADQARAGRESLSAELGQAMARLAELGQQGDILRGEHEALGVQLQAAIAALGLADLAALGARRMAAERIEPLRLQREALLKRRTRADADAATAQRQIAEHRQQRPEQLPEDASPASLSERIDSLEQEHERCASALTEASAQLLDAERSIEKARDAQKRLVEARAQAEVWMRLHELIGVNHGQRFQLFAQALNLDLLLSQANQHLARLRDRYRLRNQKDPDTGMPTLDFMVEDREQQSATRSLKTLSGGESFLVSLALALGLSDLRTSSMPVETLMLDEGFGTLDPQTLEVALAALQQLQASGRQVGIISHVAGLQEAIEARILVEPLGEGRSQVRAEVGAVLGVGA